MDHELHPPQSPVEELRDRIDYLKSRIPEMPEVQADMMRAQVQAYEDAIDVFERSQWQ